MVVRYKFRLYLFSLLMLAGFFLLVYRLWSLQIDRHAEFAKMVRVGSELKARIPGVRGEIKDRNGITLATNRAIFEVRINLGETNEGSAAVHSQCDGAWDHAGAVGAGCGADFQADDHAQVGRDWFGGEEF
jgi:cell division protein FtsI/penicillin-binding protein 2